MSGLDDLGGFITGREAAKAIYRETAKGLLERAMTPEAKAMLDRIPDAVQSRHRTAAAEHLDTAHLDLIGAVRELVSAGDEDLANDARAIVDALDGLRLKMVVPR